jgi:hypothetical protein
MKRSRPTRAVKLWGAEGPCRKSKLVSVLRLFGPRFGSANSQSEEF